MAKSNQQNKQQHKLARETKAEATKLVRALNIQSDNREQTRQVIQHVQRAMEAYLRQQGEKSRDLDKRMKKVQKQAQLLDEQSALAQENTDIEPKTLQPIVYLTGLSLLLNVGLLVWIFAR